MPKALRKGKAVFIISMLFLPVLGFLVFYAAINFNSIIMAFKRFDGFVGGQAKYSWSFENFKRLPKSFTNPSESGLLHALRNTMYFFVLEVVVMLPATFSISYFLFKKIVGYKFFRVVFYLPNILTAMIMVVSFKNLIAVDGPLSTLYFQKTGIPFKNLLGSSDTAIYVILLYCIWAGFGANMILFQGGMFRIPTEVLEAASLDGVNAWQELIFVILPMMWNTLSTVIILKFSAIFTVSGPILLFTGGEYDTYTVSYWIFAQVYNSSTDFNYASAVGLMFTVINAPIVFFVRWACNRVFADITY